MLSKVIEDYRKGLISQDDYIAECFKYHRGLADYTELLQMEGAQKIEICTDGVFLKVGRNGNCFYMSLDQRDMCDVPTLILNFGEYETRELDMVMKIVSYLDKDSVIFDIGANLGWYSLNLLSSNSKYRCHAFEPVVETFKRLVGNFEHNGFDISCLHNFGFYKEAAEMKFYYNTEESGASSLANLRENSATVEVECKMRKLDEFVLAENIDRIDFIKCDVEGSELFVYQGGKETIKKFKPIIFSEMLRKWCRKFAYHPNDIILLLRELGYDCYIITEKNSLTKIIEVTEDTVETNYFFMHREKHKRIIEDLCSR